MQRTFVARFPTRSGVTLAAALLIAAPAFSQHAQHGANHAAPGAASAALSDGEVRKVDKETRKITIRHGPLANLDMPPMTMVFQVRDPALLERVQAGDKVRFLAEKDGTAYVVTRIEK
ncbi:MAG: copper-binding protein [Anaerolineae bacterium]|jgi:Cu/Ag efflux protein CusF|nr:copper-binding protein [Anaerolineae bacterium]